jgi:outer membrane protein assembly factor BamE (lipoprotein component of BamABCDE complex)
MPVRAITPVLSILAAGALALTLSACGTGMALTTNKVEGYDISDDALAQIRPGQSQQLVLVVLGSPQTRNAFGDQTVWYYVETKVSETAFGLTSITDRKVLAIYFDKNNRVVDKALYGLKDGKVIAIEQGRTPSYGQDRTFIESILQSI